MLSLNQIADQFNHTFKPGKSMLRPTLPSKFNAGRLFELLREEIKELREGHELGDIENYHKEATDIIYVLITEMRLMGFDLDGGLAEVHRSNLTKLDLECKPIVRADGKILKGPHYEEANMAQFTQKEVQCSST